MFYSQVILARKGPLGKIWLAAHFDKKLTKNQILSTDIPNSVDSVLNPASPLALRVSGHLMLGIVRIYSRKVKYLLSDCTEAMWKIKLAFRPGNVDIDPALLTNVNNVDDARYFGNVSIDNDFPELENSAFPQFLLSSFSTQTAKAQKIASSAPTPENASNMSITSADINDLDYAAARKNGDRLLTRPSADGGRLSTLSQAKSEDMMPFDENDLFGADFGSFGASMMSVGSASKARESEGGAFPMMDDGGGGGMQMDMGDMGAAYYDDMDQAQQQLQQQQGAGAVQSVSPPSPEDDHEPSSRKRDAPVTQKASPAAKRAVNKRNRVVIDERVELPTAVIKERMADLSCTMRRDPSLPPPWKLPRAEVEPSVYAEDWGGTFDEMLMMPASVRALCPELQELFFMSTSNKHSLPFPVKAAYRAAAAEQRANEKAVTPGRKGQRQHEQVEEEEQQSQSHTANGGAEPPGHIMDEMMQFEGHYQDMGGEGGMDYQQPFDNDYAPADMHGSDHRSSGASFDGRASMGGNSMDHSFASRPQRVAAHKTAVSESISRVLERQIQTAGSDSGRSSSQGAESLGLNERTKAVMAVLEEQFKHQVSLSFDEVSSGVTKRTAASCFLEILQLKTRGFLEAKQSEPFGNITLMPAVHA